MLEELSVFVEVGWARKSVGDGRRISRIGPGCTTASRSVNGAAVVTLGGVLTFTRRR
jgi:hypothetical protein